MCSKVSVGKKKPESCRRRIAKEVKHRKTMNSSKYAPEVCGKPWPETRVEWMSGDWTSRRVSGQLISLEAPQDTHESTNAFAGNLISNRRLRRHGVGNEVEEIRSIQSPECHSWFWFYLKLAALSQMTADCDIRLSVRPLYVICMGICDRAIRKRLPLQFYRLGAKNFSCLYVKHIISKLSLIAGCEATTKFLCSIQKRKKTFE